MIVSVENGTLSQANQHLRHGGSGTVTEIAKSLNVSEGTIRNRVGRLIDEKVFQITAVTDPHKLGYDVSAIIGVSIRGANIEEAAKKIATLIEVSDVNMVSGEFDLIIQAYFRDRDHLTTFINQHLRPIEGVSHSQTFVNLRTFKASSNMHPVFE